MTSAQHNLILQSEAAKRLLLSLKESGDDDDAEIVETAIEGETSLFEAIAQAIAEIDECDVLITGLKAKEEAFSDGRRIIESRAERLRASIEQAMIVTEQDKVTLPTATISLTKRKPNVVIDNEADIPSDYWTLPKVEPKLFVALSR